MRPYWLETALVWLLIVLALIAVYVNAHGLAAYLAS